MWCARIRLSAPVAQKARYLACLAAYSIFLPNESIETFYTDLPYNIEDVFETRNVKPSQIREFFLSEDKRRKIQHCNNPTKKYKK